MIQKHVYIKNLQGIVSLNKDVLVDLSELVKFHHYLLGYYFLLWDMQMIIMKLLQI